MAVTEFQGRVCRLIAANRKKAGASYVAGGVALNLLLDAPRISRDIDLFHDAQEAVHVAWESDRRLLESQAYAITPIRELPGFVEAIVEREGQQIRMEWARDSAFRFFPLVEHEVLGLTLHPFDLATNKVLAMVGRLEVRDWVDVITCHRSLQRLGYLLWAACGKDPGFSPRSLLEHARRTTHYSAAEVAQLQFASGPPDAQRLAESWRAMLQEAQVVINALPEAEAGRCVLGSDNRLFAEDLAGLERALSKGQVRFHEGSLGGAYPRVVG